MGCSRRAGLLLAVAASHLFDPVDRPVWEQAVSAVRDALPESEFSAAWEAGQELDRDGVLAAISALADVIGDQALEAGKPPDEPRFGLTRRELEVLRLLADGRSIRAIAEDLSLSERTVEHHLLHAYTRLGLESRAAAVAFALRHGLA